MAHASQKLFFLLVLLICTTGVALGAVPATIVVREAAVANKSGTITISFNGFAETVQYGVFSTPESVASALAAMFSRDYLRSGLYAGALGPVISFGRKDGASLGPFHVTGPADRFLLTQGGFGIEPAKFSFASATGAPVPVFVAPCAETGCGRELTPEPPLAPRLVALPGVRNSVGTDPSVPGFVSVSDTAFVGDAILLNWPEMNLGNSFGVFGVTNGTIAEITQRYWPEVCDSCAQYPYSGLRYLTNNGAKRVVFLMGTFDVIGSQSCRGDLKSWDGNAGSKGDPIPYYAAEIQSARQSFPDVSIIVGTIPPLGYPYAAVGCTSVLKTLNARIKTMGADLNVPVVDFNAALQEADIRTEGADAGITPRPEGYTAIFGVYNAANR